MRINSPYITGSAIITGNLCVQGTITGTITGVASTASYAETLDGLDSTQFVQTGSFNSYTSSASSSLGDLSGSVATTTNTLSSSVSSSIGSLSGSVATTTSDLSSSIGSLSGSVATTTSGLSSSIGDLSSSVATTTSGLGGRITTIEGRYATTGSNTFVGSQVITGSLYITTDLIVQGSSSLQNITASAVSIGTNTVILNTDTPAVRFAGISVQDSGSNAGVTGSIFWDGLCNRWVYSNPATIGYSGGMLLSGPRTSTLGSEAPLTCNYIAKSGGGDHLYDSCIQEVSGSVTIGGTLCTSGVVCGASGIFSSTSYSNLYLDGTNATGWGNNIAFRSQGTDFGYVGSVGSLVGNTTKDMTIWSTTGNGFRVHTNGNNPRLCIDSNGISTFACQVCAPSSIIRGTINEQLVLDFVTGAGSYTHQSFRLCGTNQYRFIGNTNGNFVLRNDIVSSDVLTFACAGDATFSCTVTTGGNILINNPTASKKGYTYRSPASNWGPQTSGLYFNPIDGVSATPTFTVNLWNGSTGTAGYGGFVDVLTINGAGGAATFSSTLSATTGYFSCNIIIDNQSLNNAKYLQFDENISSGASALLGDIRWYNKQWDAQIKAQIVALTDTDITNGRLSFRTGTSDVNAVERLRISSTGVACFQNTICAPSITISGTNASVRGGEGALFRGSYVTQIGNNITFDAFRFLNPTGGVGGAASSMSGILYMSFSDTVTGGNQVSYQYLIFTTGNGVSPGPYCFALLYSGPVRGTNPISSITLVNDGSGGAVKVQATTAASGVGGANAYISFVGTAV